MICLHLIQLLPVQVSLEQFKVLNLPQLLPQPPLQPLHFLSILSHPWIISHPDSPPSNSETSDGPRLRISYTVDRSREAGWVVDHWKLFLMTSVKIVMMIDGARLYGPLEALFCSHKANMLRSSNTMCLQTNMSTNINNTSFACTCVAII